MQTFMLVANQNPQPWLSPAHLDNIWKKVVQISAFLNFLNLLKAMYKEGR